MIAFALRTFCPSARATAQASRTVMRINDRNVSDTASAFGVADVAAVLLDVAHVELQRAVHPARVQLEAIRDEGVDVRARSVVDRAVRIQRGDHGWQLFDSVVADGALVLPAQRAANIHAFEDAVLGDAAQPEVRAELGAVPANLRVRLALVLQNAAG